jgi:hypothetical protein
MESTNALIDASIYSFEVNIPNATLLQALKMQLYSHLIFKTHASAINFVYVRAVHAAWYATTGI